MVCRKSSPYLATHVYGVKGFINVTISFYSLVILLALGINSDSLLKACEWASG